MRARLLRPTAGLALVSAAVLSLSASAATKPLVLTDPKGDANGADVGPGPGSQDSKDIVSLTLAPLPGKKCTGYTAVMELAAPPSTNSLYRVFGTTSVNSGSFWVSYDNNPVNGARTSIRANNGTTTTTVQLATPAKLEGNKVTLTVLEKDLKAAGEKLATVTIAGISGDVRTSSGAVFAPQWDLTDDADKSFKVCS